MKGTDGQSSDGNQALNCIMDKTTVDVKKEKGEWYMVLTYKESKDSDTSGHYGRWGYFGAGGKGDYHIRCYFPQCYAKTK